MIFVSNCTPISNNENFDAHFLITIDISATIQSPPARQRVTELGKPLNSLPPPQKN